MPEIARNGDRGDGCGGNGVITGASSRYTCRGSLVARNGDAYQCTRHGTRAVIANHHWTLDGQSIVLVGDKTTCGATIRTGAEGTDVEN